MIDQAPIRDATETRLRRAYGFEEVALVPGAVTADPAEVDLATELGGFRLEIPFLAAAMDAVADTDFAVRMSRHGGVAFVNLEGLYTRYEDASRDHRAGRGRRDRPGGGAPPCRGLRAAGPRRADHGADHAHQDPGSDRRGRHDARIGLASRRGGGGRGRRPVPGAVAGQQRPAHLHLDARALARGPHRWPAAARPGREHGQRRGRLPAHAPGRGRHLRRRRPGSRLHDARGARHRGAAGVSHPRGRRRAGPIRARDRPLRPGRHRWRHEDRWRHRQGDRLRSRCGHARLAVRRRASRRPAAASTGAWPPHRRRLPRGTRIRIGERLPLEQILFGPAETSHGTQNLVGALRQSMAALGARTIREMHEVEMVIAPSIATEGKSWQLAGRE